MVSSIWEKNESKNPGFKALWESRGFSSWKEWRLTYSTPLRCAEREWNLYRIIKPLNAVSTFRGGLFKSWTEKYYKGKVFPSFAEIVNLPEIETHQGVQRLYKNFPVKTTLTGLATEKGIVIIEGMHRCCALALMAKNGVKTVSSVIFIALAKAVFEETPRIAKGA